ncbi:MAG: ATP-binding cassette domain-containing protein [Ilumatobacteraceae bacterium]
MRIAGVSKRFGAGAAGVIALDQISLDVERGEFVCIVGASGCGKSTLLNLIAGLGAPTVGSVEVQGRVALMFQEAALLPWKTAAGNVELALKLRGVPRRNVASRRSTCSTWCASASSPTDDHTSCRVACVSVSRWPVRSARVPTCC